MPPNVTKKVNLLFVMANAPVETVSLPVSGSEAFAGLAANMELAMYELFQNFPAFFEQETKPSKRSESNKAEGDPAISDNRATIDQSTSNQPAHKQDTQLVSETADKDRCQCEIAKAKMTEEIRMAKAEMAKQIKVLKAKMTEEIKISKAKRIEHARQAFQQVDQMSRAAARGEQQIMQALEEMKHLIEQTIPKPGHRETVHSDDATMELTKGERFQQVFQHLSMMSEIERTVLIAKILAAEGEQTPKLRDKGSTSSKGDTGTDTETGKYWSV